MTRSEVVASATALMDQLIALRADGATEEMLLTEFKSRCKHTGVLAVAMAFLMDANYREAGGGTDGILATMRGFTPTTEGPLGRIILAAICYGIPSIGPIKLDLPAPATED